MPTTNPRTNRVKQTASRLLLNLARQIIPRDKEVDALHKQVQRELASYIVERPSTITVCLNLMTISKSLERVADHATNIAEEVVYLYEAKDIRHMKVVPKV